MIDFKCEGENLEQIPEEIIRTGVSFPKAHTDKDEMAKLAKALRVYKGDVITRVPFCVTVEAEALGAKIKLGNEKVGPRVESYAIAQVEDLAHIQPIDFTKGRIKEVLDAVEILSRDGETVALSVEGPFTIISSIIDPMLFYKGLRSNPEVIAQFLDRLEDGLVEYIREGIKRGARIISYGDPVGSPDIVGPRVYREISGKRSYSILKKAEAFIGNAVIHLCGKTSTAFAKLELCDVEARETAQGITYGQAIYDLLEQNPGVHFIGHRCIKHSLLPLNKPVVWGIHLK